MQEIGYTLKGFSKGLRPYAETVVNREELVECFNLIPKPQGLLSAPVITSSISSDHPFPQIFIGFTHWLLCTRTAVYSINSDWSTTLIMNVSEGGVWDFADYYEYGVLTNGVVTLVYNTVTNSWKNCDGTIVPILTTVCDFNGQLLGAQDNTLLWGKIGSADFTVDQSNVAGSRPMPWFGEIYKVMKLGTGFVVYGSNGIALMRFKDTATSIVKVLNYGIVSRGAVGGNSELHTFIDVAGNLRQITDSFEVSTSAYKEFFSPMRGREVVVSYHPSEMNFYICDGVSCYVKTAEGLGEVYQLVTTLAEVAGSLIGVFGSTESATLLSIETDSMDFGSRARKTVDCVEVGSNGVGTVEIAIGWRVDSSVDFEYTEWIGLNLQNQVTIPINGVEFKIRIRVSGYSNFKISYVTVRIKADDKRFNRGISNADKATA